MGRVLPILFNTDMVRAILDGRKTVTRRVIKPRPQGCFEVFEEPLYIYDTDFRQGKILPPFRPGDILYVRETWCMNYYHKYGKYFYRADGEEIEIPTICGKQAIFGKAEGLKWRPSIHMPKAAARIWLKVTDVRVERLQDIAEEQAIAEGTPYDLCGGWKPTFYDPDSGGPDPDFIRGFSVLWNSTIKKSDIGLYGWDSNPWVWAIEFERCEKQDK